MAEDIAYLFERFNLKSYSYNLESEVEECNSRLEDDQIVLIPRRIYEGMDES